MVRQSLAFFVGIFIFCASGWSQNAINVDFSQVGGVSGLYGGVGAAPDAGVIWNDLVAGNRGALTASVTSAALVTSNGTLTAVTVTLGNFRSYDTGPGLDNKIAAAAPALLDDFVYQQNLGPTGPNSTVSINGLTPGGLYDLYLYSQNGGYANTATVFTFGGVSKIASNPGNIAGLVDGQNYVSYTGLAADAGGVISGTFNDSAAANNAAFNGLQIVIPEPASLSLLTFAFGALTLRIRRR